MLREVPVQEMLGVEEESNEMENLRNVYSSNSVYEEWIKGTLSSAVVQASSASPLYLYQKVCMIRNRCFIYKSLLCFRC